MAENFRAIFQQLEAPTARGKFLSRVFGIFSEEIVRIWCADPRSPYEDLGRPSLKSGAGRAHTLDFTLRNRQTRKLFVAEMKCEIEYQNYRYLTLTDVAQLTHHSKAAFDALLRAAATPKEQQVHVAKRRVEIDGAILIWGAVEPQGRSAVIAAKGFSEVLAITDIIDDLQAWRSKPYCHFLRDRQHWTAQLFDGLTRFGAS